MVCAAPPFTLTVKWSAVVVQSVAVTASDPTTCARGAGGSVRGRGGGGVGAMPSTETVSALPLRASMVALVRAVVVVVLDAVAPRAALVRLTLTPVAAWPLIDISMVALSLVVVGA